MYDPHEAFPDIAEYAWHRRCTSCDAEARQPCHTPRRQASHDRTNRLLAQAGLPPTPTPEYGFFHAPRADAAAHHRSRDIAAAPGREHQIPGTRYDTISREEPPHIPPVRPALLPDQAALTATEDAPGAA